jgi:hypothetical protein
MRGQKRSRTLRADERLRTTSAAQPKRGTSGGQKCRRSLRAQGRKQNDHRSAAGAEARHKERAEVSETADEQGKALPADLQLKDAQTEKGHSRRSMEKMHDKRPTNA